MGAALILADVQTEMAQLIGDFRYLYESAKNKDFAAVFKLQGMPTASKAVIASKSKHIYF